MRQFSLFARFVSSKQATCAHRLNLYHPNAASALAGWTRYCIFNKVGARNEIMRAGSAALADLFSLYNSRCSLAFHLWAWDDGRSVWRSRDKIALTLELISCHITPFPCIIQRPIFSPHALVIWLNNLGLHCLNRTPVRGSRLCPWNALCCVVQRASQPPVYFAVWIISHWLSHPTQAHGFISGPFTPPMTPPPLCRHFDADNLIREKFAAQCKLCSGREELDWLVGR